MAAVRQNEMKVNITLVTTSTWLVDGPRRRGRSGALSPEGMAGGVPRQGQRSWQVIRRTSNPPAHLRTYTADRTTKLGFLRELGNDYTASPGHRQEDRPTGRMLLCLRDCTRQATNHPEASIKPNPNRSSRAKSKKTKRPDPSSEVGNRLRAGSGSQFSNLSVNVGFRRAAAMYIPIARAIESPVIIETRNAREIGRRRTQVQ